MKRFSVLLCAVVFFSFCRMLPAQTIEVNEKAMRLMLRESGGNQLSLAVRNSSQETIQSKLQVEVLDSNGKVQGSAEKQEDIPPGNNRIVIPLSVKGDLAAAKDREMLWDRLRYTLEFNNRKLSPLSGIVAIGEITPQLFEMKTWRPEFIAIGTPYRVRVRTQHPVTRKPARGVLVNGELRFEDDKQTVLHANAMTDHTGHALLEFNVAENQQMPDSPELAITAVRDGIQRQVSASAMILHLDDAYITTDKPIYQPGQVLHVRALLVSGAREMQCG